MSFGHEDVATTLHLSRTFVVVKIVFISCCVAKVDCSCSSIKFFIVVCGNLPLISVVPVFYFQKQKMTRQGWHQTIEYSPSFDRHCVLARDVNKCSISYAGHELWPSVLDKGGTP